MKFLEFDDATLSKILTVIDSKSSDFVELVALAGLNPERDFRRSDLRDLNFGDSDFSQFDFKEADVRGADFSRTVGLRISALVNVIQDENTRWPKHLAETLSRKVEEASDFVELEAMSYDDIYRIESERQRRSALQALDQYFFAKELISRSSSSERARAGRLLFALSAGIDKFGIHSLSRLVNRLFLSEIWERFVRFNLAILPEATRPKTPIQAIANVEALRVDERVASLSEILSRFDLSSKLHLQAPPTGLLVCASAKRVLEAGSLVFQWGGKEIELVPELQSVKMFHGDGRSDRPQLFSTRSSGMGSARGPEFVKACFSVLFPTRDEEKIQFYLGASNSWLVIKTCPEYRSQLLASRGVYLQQIRDLLGLRRISVCLICASTEEEVHEFCSSAWKGLSCVIKEGAVSLTCTETRNDERKRRSFISMFLKVFPSMTLEFNFLTTGGYETLIHQRTDRAN